MPGPASGIRFIHSAIDREADELLRLAEAGELAAIRERLTLFNRVLHLHIDGEEAAIFPDVNARLPNLVPLYLLDHEEERQLRAALGEALDQGDQTRTLTTVAALREHLRMHIRKENELLVPLIEAHFSVEEQAGHMGKMMAGFAPADLAAVLPWLVTSLEVDDRRAYLAMVERAAPPERFAAMLEMVKVGVSAEVWQSLGR